MNMHVKSLTKTSAILALFLLTTTFSSNSFASDGYRYIPIGFAVGYLAHHYTKNAHHYGHRHRSYGYTYGRGKYRSHYGRGYFGKRYYDYKRPYYGKRYYNHGYRKRY